MKLLYITESVPNRDPILGDGSSMIPFEVLLNLPFDVEVTLLSFSGQLELPDEIRRRCAAIHIVARRGHISSLARSIVSRWDVGSHERNTRRAIDLAQRLSSASDVTLVHGPHLLFLAHSLRGAKVLQTVDPWSIRIGMESSLCRGWRAYHRSWKSRRTLAAERNLPVDARLLTVGAQDAAQWSSLLSRPVRSIPNGADYASAASRSPTSKPVVCFVGSLNYGPNVDSVQVLIEDIAPLVWQQVPEAKFVIAGRQPTPAVLSLAGPKVEIRGNVPRISEIFESARVAAFADEYGVGIRNSVREALSAGLPVVATSVAAREQDDHPLLTVEDDRTAFAQEIVSALISPLPSEQAVIGGFGTFPPRTWKTVADEYLEELRAAAAQERARPHLESPRS